MGSFPIMVYFKRGNPLSSSQANSNYLPNIIINEKIKFRSFRKYTPKRFHIPFNYDNYFTLLKLIKKINFNQKTTETTLEFHFNKEKNASLEKDILYHLIKVFVIARKFVEHFKVGNVDYYIRMDPADQKMHENLKFLLLMTDIESLSEDNVDFVNELTKYKDKHELEITCFNDIFPIGELFPWSTLTDLNDFFDAGFIKNDTINEESFQALKANLTRRLQQIDPADLSYCMQTEYPSVGFSDIYNNKDDSLYKANKLYKDFETMDKVFEESKAQMDGIPFKRKKIYVGPNNMRDALVCTYYHQKRFREIEILSKLIAKKQKRNAFDKYSDELLEKFFVKNHRYLMLDIKKCGISFPKRLITEVLELAMSITGVDFKEHIKLIESFSVSTEKGIFIPNRGYGLGFANGMVSVILTAIAEIICENSLTFNDDQILDMGEIDISSYTEDEKLNRIFKFYESLDIIVNKKKTFFSSEAHFMEELFPDKTLKYSKENRIFCGIISATFGKSYIERQLRVSGLLASVEIRKKELRRVITHAIQFFVNSSGWGPSKEYFWLPREFLGALPGGENVLRHTFSYSELMFRYDPKIFNEHLIAFNNSIKQFGIETPRYIQNLGKKIGLKISVSELLSKNLRSVIKGKRPSSRTWRKKSAKIERLHEKSKGGISSIYKYRTISDLYRCQLILPEEILKFIGFGLDDEIEAQISSKKVTRNLSLKFQRKTLEALSKREPLTIFDKISLFEYSCNRGRKIPRKILYKVRGMAAPIATIRRTEKFYNKKIVKIKTKEFEGSVELRKNEEFQFRSLYYRIYKNGLLPKSESWLDLKRRDNESLIIYKERLLATTVDENKDLGDMTDIEEMLLELRASNINVERLGSISTEADPEDLDRYLQLLEEDTDNEFFEDEFDYDSDQEF